MNSAESLSPVVGIESIDEMDPRPLVGVLITEGESSTPLGPIILHADEGIEKISGFSHKDLVGSPLGMIYDRALLPELIAKLPVIRSLPQHCYKQCTLMRNGGTKIACRWTMQVEKEAPRTKGLLTLTVHPIALSPSPQVIPVQAPSKALEMTVIEEEPDSIIDSHTDESKTDVAARRAQERDEFVRNATMGATHDFRNSLQSIRVNLELAELEAGSSPKVRAALQDARLSLGDAEILASQLLSYTRNEPHDPVPMKVEPLLQKVSTLATAGSGVRCRVLIDSSPTVLVDPTQLYQVLHNLVYNARQSMPNGGVIDLISAHAVLAQNNRFRITPGSYQVISVIDKGCGIPPEDLSKIFDTGFTTKKNGTGIGLATCKMIVEQYGGRILVASTLGAGTEFLIFLPTVDLPCVGDHSDAAIPTASSTNRLLSNIGTGRGQVLVVEDDLRLARGMKSLLTKFGYTPVMSKTGREAIQTYRDYFDSFDGIDCVLLDMTLPDGISGADVARELRRIDPNVVIVATSGSFTRDSKPEGGPYAAVLPKPADMSELAKVIEFACSARV